MQCVRGVLHRETDEFFVIAASMDPPLPLPLPPEYRLARLVIHKEPARPTQVHQAPPASSPVSKISKGFDIERRIRVFAYKGGTVKLCLNGVDLFGTVVGVRGSRCTLKCRPESNSKFTFIHVPCPEVTSVFFHRRGTHGARSPATSKELPRCSTGTASTPDKLSSENERSLKLVKRAMRVCCFNTRTARDAALSRELGHFFISRCLGALGLLECRWVEVPRHFRHLHHTLIPASDKGVGGMALISRYPLLAVQHFGSTCITCKINQGKFFLRLFLVHCPHSGRSEDVIAQWWSDFGSFVDQIIEEDNTTDTPHRRLYLGDWNSKTDIFKQKDHVTFSQLQFFKEAHNLRSAFEVRDKEWRQKAAHTWSGPRDTKRQLDGFLVPGRYFSDIARTRIIDPPIPSDHRPVIVDLKYHCRTATKKLPPRPDFSLLQRCEAHEGVRGQFYSRLCRHIADVPHNQLELLAFSELTSAPGWDGASTSRFARIPIESASYTNLVEGTKFASDACVLERGSSDDAKPTAEMEALQHTVDRHRRRGAIRDLAKANAQLETKEITDIINTFADQVKDQPRLAFKHLLKILGKSSKAWPDKSTPEEIRVHFEKMNGCRPDNADVSAFNGFKKRTGALPQVLDAEFTEDEVRTGQSQLKYGKATGEDGMAAEVLRLPELTTVLTSLVNDYYAGTVPAELLITLVALVPKKGDLSVCKNFRPVALISVFLKLVNRLLLHRLRVLDTVLRPSQNGFRQHRGTAAQAMALRMLIEAGSPLHLLFVDFSSAFPSITFASIRAALAAFHVPETIIKMVMLCHEGHTIRIKGEDGLPLPGVNYTMKTGVMQGDTLAPFLFIMVLDCILQEVEETLLDPSNSMWTSKSNGVRPYGFDLRKGSQPAVPPSAASGRTTRASAKQDAQTLLELGYADDLCFPSKERRTLHAILICLKQKAAQVNLRVNFGKGKTEFCTANIPEKDKEEFAVMDNEGNIVAEVEDYKYLGTNAMNHEAMITRRISLAWQATKKFRSVWRSQALFETKHRLFDTFVLAALTYGTELLTGPLVQRLDTAYSKMLRYAFGGNDTWEIFRDGAIPHLGSVIQQRRIQLVGHSLRHNDMLGLILRSDIMKTTDGRRNTLCKVLRKQLGPDPDQELYQPIYKFWPDPADRSAWRAKAREAAEEYEDKLYEKLERDRVKRWRDWQRTDTVATLRIIEVLAELALTEQHAPQTSHVQSGPPDTQSGPPPFKRLLFNWDWNPRVNVFAVKPKKKIPKPAAMKPTGFQLWLYDIKPEDRPCDTEE